VTLWIRPDQPMEGPCPARPVPPPHRRPPRHPATTPAAMESAAGPWSWPWPWSSRSCRGRSRTATTAARRS